MISMPLNEIEARARRWAAAWDGTVIDGQSTVGGGSLPGETLPTKLAALSVPSPNKFLARLRDPSDFGNPKGLAATPIIARVEGDLVVFDPRTVSQEEETDLLATVSQTFKQK